jgi:hypothetical protein
MDTNSRPSLKNLETLLQLVCDENADKESTEYRLQYNTKLIFMILKVIERNRSITINQVCGLLRNTLQVPDSMTRTLITAMISGIDSIQNLSKILRAFPTKRGAVHLNIVGDIAMLGDWMDELLAQYPELKNYQAPVYQRGPIFKKGAE